MLANIAVIDKTGRGHSICDSLITNNPDVTVYYVPGTGGIFDKRIRVVPWINIEDPGEIADFCSAANVDLVVVSHIDALKNGVADALRERGLSVLGHSAAVVKLESSKWFCKAICKIGGISTPESRLFTNKTEFTSFLKFHDTHRLLIKADWLTKNGNGAFLAESSSNPASILDEIDLIMRQNPDSPFRFLIEDYQPGTDYSAHYLLNANSIVELPSSQDFKKSRNGDQGHNCDGMGSISPHPLENSALKTRIRAEILEPMLAALNNKVGSFNGPIYLGLRIDETGRPHLIEVNTRMGDSESEVIFPLISEDLTILLKQLADEETIDRSVKYSSHAGMVISLVTGCPEADPNTLAGEISEWPNCDKGAGQNIIFSHRELFVGTKVFWANVEGFELDTIATKCGRVAHIAGFGKTMRVAREAVYGSLRGVIFNGRRLRNDIGSLPKIEHSSKPKTYKKVAHQSVSHQLEDILE